MQPYPHQQKIIDQKLDRVALFLDTGAGKTFTSLWCAENNNNRKTLIIVPKIVLTKWSKDIVALYPDMEEEEIYKDRHIKLKNHEREFIVITKEYFRDKWEEEEVDCVIVDEAHHFSGIKSRLTASLFKYLDNRPHLSIYLLTATPYRSTPWNIYTLARLLGKKWGYISFRSEMFTTIIMGGKKIYKPRADAIDKLKLYADKIGITVGIDEVIEDLPEQKVIDEIVEQTEEQKQAISKDRTVEPIVRYTKIHQIEAGYVPGEELIEREDVAIKCNKNKYVIEAVRKQPKTAIVCRYHTQINILAEELKEFKPLILTGQTKNRDTVIKDARDKNRPIIIQASVCEAYELPEIENVIFASMSWSYTDYKQMMGRFLRINAPTPTTFTRLIGGEIDQRVIKAINNKHDFYV